MSEQSNTISHSFTLSKIFHEIKNPLTLISCSLQLIEDEHPEVKDFRFWNQTLEDVRGLRILLDDISSMQNSTVLKPAPVDLREFITDLLCSMEAFFLDHAVFLDIENTVGSLTFRADQTKLRQVLVNLLKNAAEASSEDAQILLTFEQKDNNLLISVKDQGCGIPAEALSQIFEPFHTTKAYGTGLGLPICSSIIEAHGGTITVSSSQGVGTSFLITLPIT